ncbi:hypothetical protein [Haloarchaeobius amylolyticus]|uniref:hypothetical protein n=1 Tax=Haloarchaeobius amylolyticus TaxID=1198296 RepID=UPI002271039F|nr:hypothetical protein [Haloarchaeobius amylolyticus]
MVGVYEFTGGGRDGVLGRVLGALTGGESPAPETARPDRRAETTTENSRVREPQVAIVPLGDVSTRARRGAVEVIQAVYDCDVGVTEPRPLPEDGYDPERDQYEAEELVHLAWTVGPGSKNLALTDVDLYLRQRNYVFTASASDGGGSVLSTNRLREDIDDDLGPGATRAVFEDRVRKEAIHAVGGMFGLDRCKTDGCPMGAAPTPTDIDRKRTLLCGTCRTAIVR